MSEVAPGEAVKELPDALPENSWTYRRLAFFVIVGALLALRWRTVERMPPEDLREVISQDTFLIALFAVLYIVGPTAEYMVRIFKIGGAIVTAWRKP